MLTEYWIAQTIGFIAFCLGVFSFVQKQDNYLRILMLAQAYTLCLHFVLMGAFTGAIAAFITGTRNGLSVFTWAKKLSPVFYAAILMFGWLTYQSPVDILPVFAGLMGTTAFFFLSHIPMRLTLVCASSLWLVHNIVIGSIGPSLMEAGMIVAGLYRITRMKRDSAASA